MNLAVLLAAAVALTTAAVALGLTLRTAREVARRLSPYTAKRPFTMAVARLGVQPGDTLVFHASDNLTDKEADRLQGELDRVAVRMFGDGAHLGAIVCHAAELAAVIGPPGEGAERRETDEEPPGNIRTLRYGGAG